MESGEIKKYYVWERTSRKGTTETYLAETEEAVYFESGRFVNRGDWESGALRQIEEDEYQKLSIKIPQIQEAPTPWNISDEMLNGTVVNTNQIEVSNPQQKIEENPIRIILNKQKKTEKIKVPIEFEINLPAKKVMSLLDMMFDRDEVTQEIIKSVTSTIDVDSIVNTIETQIRASIESSYEEDDKKDLKENEM